LGKDFKTRGARAGEQIELLRRYWSEPLVSFEGRFDRVDRGNILPRPKRRLPIWIGGFKEAAFRRAGRFGDGFIFAGDNALDCWARIEHHLNEAGRSSDGFGRDLVTNTATTIEKSLDAVRHWRDNGGTHASVCTMGMGFDTIDAHIDFIAEVSARLDK
jgi:alkanesulfonate monooxygenase SsuD/methylene tetrahydromethanopterin reductase-like flavin-dependent oxidoreductase (luciferase family)